MGCNCASTYTTNVPINNITPIVQPEDCELTGILITTWQSILQCVKDSNKLGLIGLNTVTANQYLGILQSAINYPDNYCYFIVKLQEFQINILPRIVTNVQECI